VDWVLPKAWGDWALANRPDLNADAVRREAECFADYWRGKAGADARKADWQATWRNWIRRAGEKKTVARAAARAVGSHSGFDAIDYRAGIGADGRF
jgi:hypothetical protein